MASGRGAETPPRIACVQAGVSGDRVTENPPGARRARNPTRPPDERAPFAASAASRQALQDAPGGGDRGAKPARQTRPRSRFGDARNAP